MRDVAPDGRVAEAIALVGSKRDGHGRWPLETRHPGRMPVEIDAGGSGTRSWSMEDHVNESRVPGSTQEEELRMAPAHPARLRSRWVVLKSAVILAAGLAIAWVDTRPGWDDTGMTAGALAIAAAAGSLARIPPWLATALVVVPILAAELPGGTGALLAIPFALAGAHVGEFIRKRTVGS